MIQRALIVDDEPAIQRTMARELLRFFEVLMAGSGEEAMVQLAQNPDVCVVVSDLDLGEGCDGLQLLTHVRDSYPRSARILVSGGIADERAQEAVAMDTAHYVFHKPWERGKVVRAALSVLAELDDPAQAPTASGVRDLADRIVAASWLLRSG